jgi:hypothetical protein
MEDQELSPKEEFQKLSSEEKEQCKDMAGADLEEHQDGASEEILQYLIGIAKRFSGYRYISLSRLKGFPEGGRPLSATGEFLRITYSMTQGKNNEQFIEAFASGDVGIVQAHVEMPPLHEDGLYDQRNIAGKLIKSKVVGFVKILDKDNFKPCVLIKGWNGGYGYVEGNPFFEMDKDAFVQAVKVLRQE